METVTPAEPRPKDTSLTLLYKIAKALYGAVSGTAPLATTGGASGGYTNSFDDTATVDGGGQDILAPRAGRKTATFVNYGTEDVCLKVGGDATFGKGIYLKANGGSYEINSTNLSTAKVSAITAGSETNIAIFEGYNP